MAKQVKMTRQEYSKQFIPWIATVEGKCMDGLCGIYTNRTPISLPTMPHVVHKIGLLETYLR